MKMKQLVFKLQQNDDNKFILNWRDVYRYITLINESDTTTFVFYVQQWCEYLNYPLLHNEVKDTECQRLANWISGYTYAKGYQIEWNPKTVQIISKNDDFVIIFEVPAKIGGAWNVCNRDY